MKYLINSILLLCLSNLAFSQDQGQLKYNVTNLSTPMTVQVNLEDLPDLPIANIVQVKAAPSPLSEVQQKKMLLDRQRQLVQPAIGLHKKAAADAPSIGKNFSANITQGTPNDNDFCIGNNGMMISCVNTNMNVFNDTGKAIIAKTLSAFGVALGNLNRTYDPRTIYDPVRDRFILVYLQGSSSADTRIIVGFSTSNDPSKTWNLYQIPGNITGDSSWSDYPIIALSKDELFITVNRLKDNTFWKNGFLESYIWQIDKEKGYTGDSLPQRVYNNITYNGKPVWSICPAKGGSQLYGPEMYFLSHRPSDLSNDTVFVHTVSNTIKSGTSVLTTRVLKNPVAYGLQPNALQPNGKKLQTNDARVLSAMYEGGVIYYVGNTIDPIRFSPSIYFGRIHEIWTNTPRLEGSIISSDTLDFGYPSIAYVGSGQNGDHSSMITFSHVSAKHFPGTSVVYVDRMFNVSPPVFVKRGEGNIQLLFDSVERWGDYTGIQKKYNETGVAWLNGSFGNANNQNRTWIAKVTSNDPLSGLKPNISSASLPVKLFPNPASETITLEFEMKERKVLKIELVSMDGKVKTTIGADLARPGLNQLHVNTTTLENGIYFVNLIDDEKVMHTHRFVVYH